VDGERGLRIHPLVEEARLTDEYVLQMLARYRDDNLYHGYLWNADRPHTTLFDGIVGTDFAG
jgi:hypothetical protein